MIRHALSIFTVMTATAMAGCASELVPQTPAEPPAWAGNVVAALAMLYPPAQTKLYVVQAPAGVAETLRATGFGVADGKVTGPSPRDGYRLQVLTRDLGGGSTAVIAHVGQQTLSRAYQNGQAVTGWSFDLTGATEAMKARVALIQFPPSRIVLPPPPQPETAQR